MPPTTNIPIVDLTLRVVYDIRFQVLFGLISVIYLRWRQPRPRKGANNKAIFISGCDSGMGHRVAKRLHQLGVHVFAGCLKPEGPGAQALKEACGDRLHIVPLDITNEKQVQEAVAYVKGHLPPEEKGLYGLINNAGVLSYTNFDLMTVDLCQQVIDVNLVGTIRVTKHFLPLLRKVPGRIVTITSILARLTYPNVAVYAATKHGLEGFFSTLRYDLSSTGIHIAMVEPGDYSSTTEIMQWTQQHLEEMWTSMSPDEQTEKRHLYEAAKRKVNKKKLPPSEQEDNYKILVADVEDAILAEEPHNRYVSAPIMHRIILGLFRILPEDWSLKLMARTFK